MIGVPDVSTDEDSFSSSRQHFETVISFLDSKDSFELEHAELEEHLEETSRELFRRLFQDHLSLRAQREQRIATVVDSSGILRRSVEARHARTLSTVFGEVEVERLAYRQRGQENLHPADALLNLPEECHSHGLRRWAAIEASRGSFDSAKDAIARATRQGMGKRQIESLVGLAASDVDAFYAERSAPGCDPGDVLVLCVDGKGIVMRPEALREATRRAAQSSSTKLKTRLSKGEKRGRKRMAELGAVYDTTPIPRNATDVLAIKDEEPVPGPSAKNKWLTVSVVEDAAAVIDEAERRDEKHQRTWVALVDGNNHQVDRIETEGRQRELDVIILIDLIHVLEYCGGLPAAFSTRVIPRLRFGCMTGHLGSSTEVHMTWLLGFAVEPAVNDSRPRTVKAPMTVLAIWSTRPPISTTRGHSPRAGRSLPESSKARAVTS